MTPGELLTIAAFAINVAVMLYKFGVMEGAIGARLNEHDRWLERLDRRRALAEIE